MKRFWALAPLAALIALAGAFALVLARGGGERGFARDALVGQPAPTYALAAMGGGPALTSVRFAGQAHVVNFFASWCAPCRVEHPALMALARRGVVVVGVAYKDTPEKSRRFLETLGNPYRAAGLDPAGRAGLDFGITGVPETFVIGADGRVLAAYRGPLDAAVVEREILPALAAGAPR